MKNTNTRTLRKAGCFTALAFALSSMAVPGDDVGRATTTARDTTQDTSVRVKACETLADIYTDTEPRLGWHYGTMGLALAQANGGPRRIEMLLSHTGMCALSLGRPDTALILFSKARKRAEQAQDLRALAMSYFCLGEYYFAQNYMDSARTYINAAVAFALNAHDMDIVYRSHLAMGKLLFREGDFAEALKRSIAAHDFFVEKGNSRLVASALNNIALVHSAVGQHFTANATFHEALAAIAGDTCDFQRAKIYGNLGNNFGHWGDFDSSAYFLRLSRDLFLRTGATDLASLGTLNLGEAHFMMGDYPEAIEMYLAAREGLGEKASVAYVAICDHNIARAVTRIFTQRDRPRNKPWHAEDTIIVRTRVYSLLECITTFNNVVDLLREQPYKQLSTEVFGCLAQAYFLIGDTSSASKAYLYSMQLSVSSAEANLVAQLAYTWQKDLKERTEREAAKAHYMSILQFGFVGVALLLIILVLVRLAPHINIIRVLFFLLLVFAVEWIHLLTDTWVIGLVSGSIYGMMAIYLAFGILAMLGHIRATATFHEYLKRRSAERHKPKSDDGDPPQLRAAA